MRCRYCNKSISLLRRLNDTEFCSDAHRSSYASEQQMALRRMAEAPVSLQKTQRMAAAPLKPESAPAAKPEPPKGVYFTTGPWAVPGAEVAREFAAVDFAAAPMLPVRESRQSLLFRWTPRPVPVLAQVEGGAPEPRHFGLLFRRRIALPRRRRASLRGTGWGGRTWEALAAVPFQPCTGDSAALASNDGLLQGPLAARPVRRTALRAAQLSRVEVYVALPELAAAALTGAAGRSPKPYVAGRRELVLPNSRLRAVAPPLPEQNTELPNAIWEAMESAGIGALLAATSYPTVSPVSPAAPARSTHAKLSLAPVVPRPLPRFSGSGATAALAAPAICLEVEAPESNGRVANPSRWDSEWEPVLGAAPIPAWNLEGRALQLGTAERVAWHELEAAGGGAPSPSKAQWTRFRRESEAPIAYAIPASRFAAVLPEAAEPGELAGVLPVRDLELAGAKAVASSQPRWSRQSSLAKIPVPEIALRTGNRGRAEALQPLALEAVESVLAQRTANPDAMEAAPLLPSLERMRPASGQPRQSRRLFAVRGAQPLARAGEAQVRLCTMSNWGGRPAMVPLRLDLDDGSPRPAAGTRGIPVSAITRMFSGGGLRRAWSKAAHLPSDLKWIAMVVPLVLGIWAVARPTEKAAPAPRAVAATDAPEVEVPEVLEQKAMVKPVNVAREASIPATPPAPLPPPAPIEESAWDRAMAKVASRASVDLFEDFRNGLSLWEGKGEWARSWSYDRSGTVRPGAVALFQPSVNLSDYVVEMKASIERRSIQWLVRASDLQNYHAYRLNVTPGAPLTKLELERWTVMNGHAGKVVRLPLPHGAANQTLYSIRIETKGDGITTYLQDQVIDSYSDSKLATGGIGLVGAGEDRPRIYEVRLYHQNDFLGKLCSFLAPPPIHNQGQAIR